eukprot:PhM_4_TR16825/c0_g1_i2/m.47907
MALSQRSLFLGMLSVLVCFSLAIISLSLIKTTTTSSSSSWLLSSLLSSSSSYRNLVLVGSRGGHSAVPDDSEEGGAEAKPPVPTPEETAASTRILDEANEATPIPTTTIPRFRNYLFADDVEGYLIERSAIREVPVEIFNHNNKNKSSSSRCHTPSTSYIRKLEYTHRRARPKELGTMQFLEEIREIAATSNGAVTLYTVEGSVLPKVVHQYPITLSNTLVNLSKPFGGWKAFFLDPREERNIAKMGEPQVTAPQPPMYVARVRRAWASRGYVVTACGEPRIAFGTGACLWDFYPNEVPLVVPPQQQQQQQQQQQAFVLCDSWCGGY